MTISHLGTRKSQLGTPWYCGISSIPVARSLITRIKIQNKAFIFRNFDKTLRIFEFELNPPMIRFLSGVRRPLQWHWAIPSSPSGHLRLHVAPGFSGKMHGPEISYPAGSLGLIRQHLSGAAFLRI